MSVVVIIDTDVLIDVGRGIEAALNTITRMEAKASLLISVVTQMELIVGCRDKAELQTLDRFLDRFMILPLNEPTSIKAVELLRQYRLSHGLLIPDALIAATALIHEGSLISKNQRDYRFVAGLDLLPYPESSPP